LNTELLSLFLPEGLLEYFTVTSIDKQQESFTIVLEEKNITPVEYSGNKLVSKGFYDQVSIKDFPVRGRACYLQLKRRRWFNGSTNQYVSRNWDLVAKGTRMTQEFADFLKEMHRYQSGKL